MKLKIPDEAVALQNKTVLVGYGDLWRYAYGEMRFNYQLHVGKVENVFIDPHFPKYPQLEIKKLHGIWISRSPSIRCCPWDPTDPGIGVWYSADRRCYFRCDKLHRTDTIKLTQMASGKTVRPKYLGFSLDVRNITNIDPKTGRIDGYAQETGRTLDLAEIFTLLGLYKFPFVNALDKRVESDWDREIRRAFRDSKRKRRDS